MSMLPLDGETANLILSVAGGGGFGWLIFKKLLAATSKADGEMSAYEAMQSTVKTLQDENQRLHKTVSELQHEVAKLHVVIAELTNKLTSLSISSENQKVIDQLASEGKIDRRQKRN